MAVYVMLAFDDDNEAKEFVKVNIDPRGQIAYGEDEQVVQGATVRGVWKKPTLFCDPSDGHADGHGRTQSRSFSRGKKYGWWVCVHCGKPRKQWAAGDAWYTALGTNLLPKELAPEYRPRGWESPEEWTDLLPKEATDG